MTNYRELTRSIAGNSSKLACIGGVIVKLEVVNARLQGGGQRQVTIHGTTLDKAIFIDIHGIAVGNTIACSIGQGKYQIDIAIGSIE